MNNNNDNSTNTSNIQKLVRASLLLSICIVFQIIGRNVPQINQFLVGPIINCVLILTVILCGRWLGMTVGILTPLLAFFVGQLATPLAPFIPFIIIGNLTYVFIFSLFQEGKLLKQSVGIVSASILKFAFLFLAATKLIYVFKLNFPAKITNVLAVSMGIPQLVTALLGGAFALIIINLLTKRNAIS